MAAGGNKKARGKKPASPPSRPLSPAAQFRQKHITGTSKPATPKKTAVEQPDLKESTND